MHLDYTCCDFSSKTPFESVRMHTIDDRLVKKGTVVAVPSIKAYRGSDDIDPLIPNLSPIWRLAVKFRSRPIYRRELIPVPIPQKAERVPGLFCTVLEKIGETNKQNK